MLTLKGVDKRTSDQAAMDLPGHILLDALKASLRVVLAHVGQVEVKVMGPVQVISPGDLNALWGSHGHTHTRLINGQKVNESPLKKIGTSSGLALKLNNLHEMHICSPNS